MRKDFRVLIFAPGASIWTEPVDVVTAALLIGGHRRLGVAASLIENNRPRHQEVEGHFAAAEPAELLTMHVVCGCDCAKCQAQGPAQRVAVRAVRVVRFAVPAAALAPQPGEEPLPSPQEIMGCGAESAASSQEPELVTSKEQLAAALGLPPSQVVEVQPLLPAVKTAAGALLDKAAEFALALLGIVPPGKGTP